MRFVRELDECEISELETMRRTAVGRVSQRAHMVLLSSQGYCIAKVARIFNASENTVRQWIVRYEAHGIDGLCDRPRSGRPPKVSAALRASIEQDVQEDPAELGYLFSIWTVGKLCSHVETKYGIEISSATMYNLLKSLGFRHNRPRHAPKRGYDPQAKAKMDAITEVLSSPVAGNHMLFQDECDLHLLPTIRAMWMQCSKQTRVPTPSTNQKKSVFGALDIRSGGFIHQVFDRKRSVEFIKFLECIASRYPTGRIHIILDNYSIHKSRAVQEWLARHPRVKLYFLPCYKPQLNPVEKIWWLLKAAVTANRLYGLMDALIDAVIAFLDNLTPSEIQTLAA